MVPLRPLFVGLALFGCSNNSPAPVAPGGPVKTDLRVVNGTAEPFAFFAIAADVSPLLDPVPEASVDESWVHVVAPGGDRPVGELIGREEAPEGGVAVYLYELVADGTRVRFTRMQLVSGLEIRRAGNRIVIRRLRS